MNYTFSHIDVPFCKKFEDWMRSKGNKDTTLSYQFHTLRAAYNKDMMMIECQSNELTQEQKQFAFSYLVNHLSELYAYITCFERLKKLY